MGKNEQTSHGQPERNRKGLLLVLSIWYGFLAVAVLSLANVNIDIVGLVEMLSIPLCVLFFVAWLDHK